MWESEKKNPRPGELQFEGLSGRLCFVPDDPRQRICKTCTYFVLQCDAGLGECRRHAPDRRQNSPTTTERQWPIVDHHDWCGDHMYSTSKGTDGR